MAAALFLVYAIFNFPLLNILVSAPEIVFSKGSGLLLLSMIMTVLSIIMAVVCTLNIGKDKPSKIVYMTSLLAAICMLVLFIFALISPHYLPPVLSGSIGTVLAHVPFMIAAEFVRQMHRSA